MMIKMLFYPDLSGKNFCQKILKSKNFKQKLLLQVVEEEAAEARALRVEAEAPRVEAEAPRVEAEAVQKLSLPHP